MTDTPPSSLSSQAREVARILRMYGATDGQTVRGGMLDSLWGRHSPRSTVADLTKGVKELIAAGLLKTGKPDGVTVTAETLKVR